jgi:hypothetical protein
MRARVRLTGIGDSGPAVHVYVGHVSSVFDLDGETCVSVVGLEIPHVVTESVDRVLELLDAAEGGVSG